MSRFWLREYVMRNLKIINNTLIQIVLKIFCHYFACSFLHVLFACSSVIFIMAALWHYHWGQISAARAEAVLSEDNRPGTYLIRENVRDTIVSFVDPTGVIEHVCLPVRKDCNLFKAFPDLDGKPQEIFNFMREKTGCIWLYPAVLRPGDTMGAGEVNTDHKASCRVCGLQNVSK